MAEMDFAKSIERKMRGAFQVESNSAATLKRPRNRTSQKSKVTLYKLLLKLRRQRTAEAVRDYVRERDGRVWDGKGDEDAAWLVRLVIGKGSPSKINKQRERLTADIGLAAVNEIRPRYLLAFIYEAGPTPLIQQAWQDRTVFGWAKKYRKPSRLQRTNQLGDTWQ
jgi:hypothetical protein